jgi:hypothetical protein
LQGGDGDGPSCFSSEVRTARKEHVCGECRCVIAPGTKYEYASGVWDGRPDSFKTCSMCAEIRDHFACEGWIYEQLWGDLQENFFPDMVAGGPCMQGLSPAAKQKLIDERMEWYFDLGEINDEVWEDWPKHRDRQRELRTPVDNRTVLFGDERPRNYTDWEAPEVYWPRQLQLEAEMRAYEESKDK